MGVLLVCRVEDNASHKVLAKVMHKKDHKEPGLDSELTWPDYI